MKNTTASKIEAIMFTAINSVFMILIAACMVYPFWNTIAVSLNEAADTLRGGISFLPRRFTLYNYEMVFKNSSIFHAFYISVTRTVINMITSVFFTAMIAFALSRKEFFMRKPFTLIMILSMYVNAGLIPNYFLMRGLGMVNSFWVYIIPGMVNAFNFVIIRTYMNTLPESIIESARIDGCGDFIIFIRIILPLCVPVLATIALFVAVGSWNSWFDTMIYNSQKVNLHTLQYKLMEYLQSSQTQSRAATDTASIAASQASGGILNMITPQSIRAAITVVAAAPILFVYPFMQRYFVVGINVGGVKE
jgi:putative aldouronate transport system permease protein